MSLLDQNAPEAIEAIKALEDKGQLEQLEADERAGKNRGTVLQAITEARIALDFDTPAVNDGPVEAKKDPGFFAQVGQALAGVFTPFALEAGSASDIIPGEPEAAAPPPVIVEATPLIITLPLSRTVYSWLPRDIEPGTRVYLYRGKGYRINAAKPYVPVTFDENGYGSFFEVPNNMLARVQ